MTTENEKNENSEENDSVANSENEKTSKVAEKLKTMGVMSSEKKDEPIDEPVVDEPVNESRRFSPLLITMLVAIPAVAIIAYMNMPDQFNQWLSSITGSSSTASEQQDNPAIVNAYAQTPQTQMPQRQASVNAVGDRWNRPGYQSQEPQWVAQQKADMEKRRLEFQKQNPEPEWLVAQRADMEKRRLAFLKQNPEPEWVTKQRADMEKRRLEFEKQNSARYGADWRQPAEPPQWVKDRQAEMERDMARYQENARNHSNGSAYNRAPEYMQHPRVNSYQQNGAGVNNRMQPRQNQNPVQAYPQAQRQYYNTYNYPPNPYYYNVPRNGFRQNNAPYGRYGYPY